VRVINFRIIIIIIMAPWWTYVAEDGYEGEEVEDAEPGADVLSLEGRHALVVLDHLVRVESQLDDVVDQGAQRRQRKRRHEDRHESELDHCTRHSVRKFSDLTAVCSH